MFRFSQYIPIEFQFFEIFFLFLSPPRFLFSILPEYTNPSDGWIILCVNLCTQQQEPLLVLFNEFFMKCKSEQLQFTKCHFYANCIRNIMLTQSFTHLFAHRIKKNNTEQLEELKCGSMKYLTNKVPGHSTLHLKHSQIDNNQLNTKF